jgi:chitinase
MKLRIRILTTGVLFVFAAFCAARGQYSRPLIIVGYVFPRGAVLKSGQINAHDLDRINYAFASTKNGRLVAGSAADEQNLATLTALKKEKPSLQILISVGGWLGSKDFSDIALTAQSRKTFIESAMNFLEHSHLDGLDLDWEYPGQAGAGHAYRAEDKQNFTLLLEDLRERFSQEEKVSGRRLYLTIAAEASDEYIAHTEMAKVQDIVDAVNVMAYDFNEAPSHGLTSHQAPLYTDPRSPISDSIDSCVSAYEYAGVPATKLILGVPFYGRSWERVSSADHGLFQQGRPAGRDFIPFAEINGSMLGHGFSRYWDAAASAAYLYSEDQKIFVSYDDQESLTRKCSYVLSHRLGGIMFWEYFDDPNGTLLGAIVGALRASEPATH